MDYSRRSEADDGAAWSIHETDGSYVHSEVRGNVSSLSQMSSQLGHEVHPCETDNHDNCRGGTRCQSFKKFGYEFMRRLRPTKPAGPAKSTHPQSVTEGKAQPKTLRRRTNGSCVIGEAYGDINTGAIADSGYAELNFRDDPTLLPIPEYVPHIPAEVDGVFIGRVVGNLNTGGVGSNARVVMTYEPRRGTISGSSRSSSTIATDSLVGPHDEDEASRHGYSKIAPRYAKLSPTGSFPGSGRTLSQEGGSQSRRT